MTATLIGLTGGIATGKTTASAYLASLGAEVLCADSIYHELLRPISKRIPSPLATKIEQEFPGVLLSDGTIDRGQLGKQVFGQPQNLEKLGVITHPAVALEAANRMQKLENLGINLIIYDVPLLFERGLDKTMAGVILIWVPEEIQINRLIIRDKISRTQATQKLGSQLPITEKKKKATWLIDNSHTQSQMYSQIDSLWSQLNQPITK